MLPRPSRQRPVVRLTVDLLETYQSFPGSGSDCPSKEQKEEKNKVELVRGRYETGTNETLLVCSPSHAVMVATDHKQQPARQVVLKCIPDGSEQMVDWAVEHELRIVQYLNRAQQQEPDNSRKYVVTLRDAFYWDQSRFRAWEVGDAHVAPEDKPCLCLVFDHLQRSLNQVIHCRRPAPRLTHLQVAGLGLQLLHALAFFGRHGVVHGDIKPANLMLARERDPFRGLEVIDFGLSRFVTDPRCSTEFGIQTPYYRAPEVALRQPYGTQIDVWSAGCVLFELYTGVPLFQCKFEQNADLLTRIKDVLGATATGQQQPKNQKTTRVAPLPPRPLRYLLQALRPSRHRVSEDDLFEDLLLKHLLVWDPHERATAVQALSHPYFVHCIELCLLPLFGRDFALVELCCAFLRERAPARKAK